MEGRSQEISQYFYGAGFIVTASGFLENRKLCANTA
jgi:hypothetical protein